MRGGIGGDKHAENYQSTLKIVSFSITVKDDLLTCIPMIIQIFPLWDDVVV